jgi:hypothetical protein
MLGSFKYIRPFYLKRIQYRFKLGYIVAVSSGYYQRQRRLRPVYRQMPFAFNSRNSRGNFFRFVFGSVRSGASASGSRQRRIVQENKPCRYRRGKRIPPAFGETRHLAKRGKQPER